MAESLIAREPELADLRVALSEKRVVGWSCANAAHGVPCTPQLCWES